jgi:hypothetical protein
MPPSRSSCSARSVAVAAKLYNDGIQAERQAQLTKAVKLVKERDALNVQIKTATPADVCRRLGGKWLPDTNECG